MKVGLFDIDNTRFPNLPLMKLASYHKNKGDKVEIYDPFKHYDLVYQAKVFSDELKPDYQYFINADKVIKGGTGYDLKNLLPFEVEHQYPDYEIYPDKTKNTAYGFLTRGCPRGCHFCIVAEKEGRKSYQVAELSEFWRDQKNIVLLDPNITACKDKEKLFQDLIKSKAWIDFSQGIDVRLLTKEDSQLINQMKIRMLHFAWDYPDQDLTKYFIQANKYLKVRQVEKAVYVLTNFNSTHEEDLFRVDWLKANGFNPYVMIFEKWKSPKITRQLQRYVNNKRIFWSVENFENYKKIKKVNKEPSLF